jgi:DNA replication regulator SLD3
VLAVRLAANGGLYVVERVKRGIYSLSKLARWVNEANLLVAAKGWHAIDAVGVNSTVVEDIGAIPDGFDWWQGAQIDEPMSDVEVGDKPAGLDIAVVYGPSETDLVNTDSSLVGVLEHRSHSLAPSRSFDAAEASSFLLAESQGSRAVPEDMDVDGVEPVVGVQQSPEELLDGMRDQYLQALYVSKVMRSIGYLKVAYLTVPRLPWLTLPKAHLHAAELLSRLVNSLKDQRS